MTDSKPSKSEQKRRQTALHQIGEELIKLRDEELTAIPIDDRLRDAVRDAKAMHKHGALRRQKQLITKLMRAADPEPIRASLALLKADDRNTKRIFARAEHWRDRIVGHEPDALGDFQKETNGAATDLPALLAELNRSQSEAAHKAVSRKIFRSIHTALNAAQDDRLAK